jgi:hypothetical protein
MLDGPKQPFAFASKYLSAVTGGVMRPASRADRG